MAPSGIDPTVPSVARVYDYLLGGKENYEVDRQVVEMIRTISPEAPLTARTNRAFGRRAVRYIAEQGVRQFVDLGSGIPTTRPAVHETARAVDPSVRVVYVDFDPLAVAHSRALQSVDRGLATILADIRQPETVLNHPDVQMLIDFDEPVGVVIFSVLAFVEDAYDPAGIVGQFRQRMAAGSYLANSELSARSKENAIARCHVITKEVGFPAVKFRTDHEVLRSFEGLDLVEPGLVEITQWRPEQDGPRLGMRFVGGVGRKPGRVARSKPS